MEMKAALTFACMNLKKPARIMVRYPGPADGYAAFMSEDPQQARLSRIASEKWKRPMADVMHLFSEYKVLEYIEDCFEIFHVQGDEVNFQDIEHYLQKKGAFHADSA